MYVHIYYVYAHVCVYISKYNLFSLYNVTYMYFFLEVDVFIYLFIFGGEVILKMFISLNSYITF